jgi:hypothetical protein
VDATTQQDIQQGQTSNLQLSQSELNGLGLFGTGQGAAIVEQFVAAANAEGGKFTVAQVEADINDPTVEAALMPYIMQDLANILALPVGPCSSGQTCRTADQEAFVQQIESFIQAQRQAAAVQAENDYSAWYQQQVASQVQQIESLPPGAARIEMAAVISSNPPIPPQSILQEAALGMDMTPAQTATMSKIISATNGIERLATAAASDPSSLDGYIAGTISDTSEAISMAAASARELSDIYTEQSLRLYSVVRALNPSLARKIFPWNSSSASIGEKAAERAIAAGTAAELTEGMEIFKDVTSAAETVGQLVEVGANLVQIAVSAAEYGQIDTYNSGFNKAIAADNAPVTDATLNAMLNTSGGAQTLYGYLEGFMATGNSTPLVTSSALPTSVFESQTL